jgi:hypothetical protein
MWEVMTSCVIMHNMIVQEERDKTSMPTTGNLRLCWLSHNMGHHLGNTSSICIYNSLRGRITHDHLQADLIEHMWIHRGNQPG